MTNVNANQHSALLAQNIWELHSVEISTCFTVDLTQNVSGLREIELETSPPDSHNLRRHSVLLENFFEHCVIGLSIKHDNDHTGMLELAIRHHVLNELLL